MIGADLSGANLRGTNLRGVDLSSADLRGADLSGANLRGANLRGADLRGTNLRGADLRGTNLRGTNLRGANLRGANLPDDPLFLAQHKICPTEGSFVGWKKLASGAVAKLVIPYDAARCNAIGSRTCRAEMVYVGGLEAPSVSQYDKITRYVQGARVIPDSYDPDVRVECSHGIHFFITREEAEAY